jgi:hypothetical protein
MCSRGNVPNLRVHTEEDARGTAGHGVTVAERRSAIHSRTSPNGGSDGLASALAYGRWPSVAGARDVVEDMAVDLVIATTHAARPDVHVQVRIV